MLWEQTCFFHILEPTGRILVMSQNDRTVKHVVWSSFYDITFALRGLKKRCYRFSSDITA